MQFDILRQTRRNHLQIIQDLDEQQLNLIPAGFNNNLIWNLGHVVVTQQLLCYKLSGNRLVIDTGLVNRYKKGSKPEGTVETAEIEQIKDYALRTIGQLEQDYKAGLFQQYQNYSTSYGVTLNNIDAAILFNCSHEAMHLGTMIDLKRFV